MYTSFISLYFNDFTI